MFYDVDMAMICKVIGIFIGNPRAICFDVLAELNIEVRGKMSSIYSNYLHVLYHNYIMSSKAIKNIN